jgi:hypothetical protein
MLRRWIGVLILPVAGITALAYADLAGRPVYNCLGFGVELFFLGVVCCLVGSFPCAALFAVFRAPPVAYVVLVAAMTLVAAAGSAYAYATIDACGDWDWSRYVPHYAGLFLVASLVGLVIGFMLGSLVAFLFDRLARRWRQA